MMHLSALGCAALQQAPGLFRCPAAAGRCIRAEVRQLSPLQSI